MLHIKRGILIYLAILLLSASFVLALPVASINAPSNVNPGDSFSVTGEGYNAGSYIDKIEIRRSGFVIETCNFAPSSCGTSSTDKCSCTKLGLSETTGGVSITYSSYVFTGAAQSSANANIQVGTNDPPSFTSINIPSSAAASHSFDISITADDSTGMKLIKILRQSDNLNLGTELCTGFPTTCTLSVSGQTETSSQTYVIEAFDKLDLSASTTRSITITPNNAPTITTSSLPDATAGQSYSTTISATDP